MYFEMLVPPQNCSSCYKHSYIYLSKHSATNARLIIKKMVFTDLINLWW